VDGRLREPLRVPRDDRHVQRQPEPAKPPHTRDTLAQEFVTKRDVAASSATWIAITFSMIGCSDLPSRNTFFCYRSTRHFPGQAANF
jgi:hypothetical protein